MIELTKRTKGPLAYSWIYQKSLKDAFMNNIDGILSKQQCGCRKGFNAQHSLLKLLEKSKQSSEQGLVFGVLL